MFAISAHPHLSTPVLFKLAVRLEISSIHFIFTISELTCYYLNNKIMFVLQVPLVTPQEFYLYHNIPLPIPHNNVKPDSYSLIKPTNKYIAITKDKAHYSGLESLSGCKVVESLNYICSIPNVFSCSANPCCESELLSKVITELPVQCKTEFISGVIDIWKPITNNKWIFVQTTPTKLSIDCFNLDLTDINISGTGILSIPKRCTAYCKNTRLYSNNNVLNISSPLYVTSDFNIINDSCCNLIKFKQTIDKETISSPIKLQNVDLENIEFNHDITDELDKIINEPHIIKYGTHYSILVNFVILFIVCLIVIKFCKLNVCKKPSSNHELTEIPLEDIRSSSPKVEDDIESEKSPPRTRRGL